MPHISKNRAVFFTTDKGYLIPTLVAARQVLEQAPVKAIADVLIFLVDFSPEAERQIADEIDWEGLSFYPLHSERYTLPDNAVFNQTHVPRSALARLAVGPDIPARYEHLVYLDGDIQITGSILPLVSHDVTPGRILAASEHAYMLGNERGRHANAFRRYLTGLEIDDPRDYFNSGVLAARRESWAEIAAEALDFMRRHSALCLYHDQSALNAVSRGRREVLSPAYNFVSWYADLNAMDLVAPAVIHFTGGAKPWFSKAAPWLGRFRPSYDRLLGDYPFLRAFWSPPSPDEAARSDAAFRSVRRRVRLAMPWRMPFRRARIKRYLAETRFSV